MAPALDTTIVTGQNFTCLNCGRCCQRWHVALRPGEAEKLTALRWPAGAGPDDGTPTTTLIGGHAFVAHAPNGNCIYWDPAASRCLIHARFGYEAKPLGCRIYPLNIASTFPGSVSVAARFDCPAIQQNNGQPLCKAAATIGRFVEELRPSNSFDESDLASLEPETVRLLCRELARQIVWRPDYPTPMKSLLLVLLAERLSGLGDSFLNDRETMAVVLPSQIAKLSGKVAATGFWNPPGRISRLAYRQWLAAYLRRDEEIIGRGLGRRCRRALLLLKMTGGNGALRSLGSEHPDYSLNQAGVLGRPAPGGRLPPVPGYDADTEGAWAAYWRMLAAKLETCQFFGPCYYGTPFFMGLRALAQSYALVLGAAKTRAAAGQRQAVNADDVHYAVGAIDHSLGRSALLGMAVYRSLERHFDGSAYGRLLAALGWK